MANLDIREAIKEAGIKYWQVAREYGITDGNFSKLLRTELSNDKKSKIFDIISQVKKEE